jgi:hypothetical protein
MLYENVVAAPRLDPKPVRVGFVVDKVWYQDKFLLKALRFFRQYHSTNAPLGIFHDAIQL